MYTPETGGRVVAIHALPCSSHAEEAVPVPVLPYLAPTRTRRIWDTVRTYVPRRCQPGTMMYLKYDYAVYLVGIYLVNIR